MKKVIKIILIILVLVCFAVSIFILFSKNSKLNTAYETSLQQVSQLQSKLDAIGTFTDVYTVKIPVKMGQQITAEDLVLQTILTSSVPTKAITDINTLVGNYYRIGLEPGVTLTSDFVVIEEYIGSVYDRDVFLDSLPVGTVVGDYIDIRVVLPGGEEFVVFPHRRVNARFDNAIKMNFDEADLWIYTSMMVDRTLYMPYGFKLYATKYIDPGAHDKTVAYYPVRKEVIDIMNISGNLTDKQRSRMWNENLRASIDTKLAFYTDPLNTDAGTIAGGVSEETGRFNSAEAYYKSIVDAIKADPNYVPPDPNASGNIPSTGDSNIGNLGEGEVIPPPTTDGQKDSNGNGSVIEAEDYLDNLGDDLFDKEPPIE